MTNESEPFAALAMSHEAGVVIALCRQHKVFPSNTFRNSPHSAAGTRKAMIAHKQHAVD